MRDLMPTTVNLVEGWETTGPRGDPPTVFIYVECSSVSGPSISTAPLSEGTL